MSAGQLPGEIRHHDPEWAEKKLAEILEWRLGRTDKNQAIINDCKSAGILFSVPTLDEIYDTLDSTGVETPHLSSERILELCHSKAKP